MTTYSSPSTLLRFPWFNGRKTHFEHGGPWYFSLCLCRNMAGMRLTWHRRCEASTCQTNRPFVVVCRSLSPNTSRWILRSNHRHQLISVCRSLSLSEVVPVPWAIQQITNARYSVSATMSRGDIGRPFNSYISRFIYVNVYVCVFINLHSIDCSINLLVGQIFDWSEGFLSLVTHRRVRGLCVHIPVHKASGLSEFQLSYFRSTGNWFNRENFKLKRRVLRELESGR